MWKHLVATFDKEGEKHKLGVTEELIKEAESQSKDKNFVFELTEDILQLMYQGVVVPSLNDKLDARYSESGLTF